MHIELKNLVYENCMSLRQFAKKSGLAYATIHSLANNPRTLIQISTIEKICKALNCTPNDIFIMD